MAANDEPFVLNEGDRVPDFFDEAGNPHYNSPSADVPLPRPRPLHKGDKAPAPRMRPEDAPPPSSSPPGALPSGPDFGSPEYGMPAPEAPHPHPQYPMEDRQHLSDMLRQALADNHGVTAPLGNLPHDQQAGLALALQDAPSDPSWTPGPKNPITPYANMLPNGFDPMAAWRAWIAQSQHPNDFPDQDGRVFRTTEADI